MPAQTKIIQGTFQKSRNPESEAKFSAVESLPPAPEGLNEHGQRLWQYGTELVAAGVITAPDIIAFEMCCAIYGRYKILENFINADPVNEVEREQGGRTAQAQQLTADFEACIKMMTEFGMTPASRNKFGVTKKPKESDEEKRMKELVFGQA